MFRKVFRGLLVCCLVLSFSGMAHRALSKYYAGQVGSTTVYRQQREFQFPTISVCSYTENATDPFVVYAQHFLKLGGRSRPVKVSQQSPPFKRDGSATGTIIDPSKLWSMQWPRMYRSSTGIFGTMLCQAYTAPHNATTPAGSSTSLTLGLQTKSLSRYHNAFILRAYLKDTLGQLFPRHGRLFALPSVPRTGEMTTYHYVAITPKESHMLNTADYLCKEEDYSRKKCAEKLLGGMFPCLQQGSDDSLVDEPACNNADKVSHNTLWRNGSVELQCPPPCKTKTFELNLVSSVAKVPRTGALGTADMAVVLFFGQPHVTVSKEYIVYDFGSLAGEMCGLLGVLLGVSALTVFDSLANSLEWTLAKLKRRSVEGHTINFKLQNEGAVI